MAAISRASFVSALVATLIGVLAYAGAIASPVTFSTTGVWSISGTNVVNFTNANGTTTLTFNGTTNPVNTPVGASFGDIVVTTTVPANVQGPALGGNFTLNFIQVSPAGAGSLVGTVSGTLGFNTGVATLTFSTTSISIGGFTYTIAPASYTIVLPVTGVGGGAGTGTTTLQGTITGGGPTITKAFGASDIPFNGITSLTFNITNPANVPLTGVAFTDNLPGGLVITTPNGLSGSCGAGTITATAGTNVVSLTGGTIAALGSCSFSVNVLGIQSGPQANTTGAISSTEFGTGQPSNTATVNVQLIPVRQVPALQEWILAALVLMLGGLAAMSVMRRRQAAARRNR